MSLTGRQKALIGLFVGGWFLLMAMATDPIVYETTNQCVDTLYEPNCTEREVAKPNPFYQFSLFVGGLLFSISLTWLVISSAVRAGVEGDR